VCRKANPAQDCELLVAGSGFGTRLAMSRFIPDYRSL